MQNESTEQETGSSVEIPEEFICSLTMDLMHDPVLSKYGQSYEREAIFKWLARGNDTCPMSRRPLRLSDLITNHALRSKIRRWQVENDEDITVIVGDSQSMGLPGYMGFLELPEADVDPTERSEDDDDIVEYRRSRPSHRASSRRQTRSSRQSRTEAASRSTRSGFMGIFGSRSRRTTIRASS